MMRFAFGAPITILVSALYINYKYYMFLIHKYFDGVSDRDLDNYETNYLMR